MKKIAIVSGKGGTGKTSITAGLSRILKNSIIADCDVDGSDMRTLMDAYIIRECEYNLGSRSAKENEECIGCKKCIEACRFDALEFDRENNKVKVIDYFCTGCELCTYVCPADAIYMINLAPGKIIFSESQGQYIVSAWKPSQTKGSGKIVNLIRKYAEDICLENKLEYIFIDSAPGIGCPVISSIVGTDLILIVIEPSDSGLYSLNRMANLAKHFNIKILVIINKKDINLKKLNEIKNYCSDNNLEILGEIPFVNNFFEFINKKILINEINEIKEILNEIKNKILDFL